MKQVVRSVKHAEFVRGALVPLLSVRKHEIQVTYLKSSADHGYLNGTECGGIPVRVVDAESWMSRP